MRKLFSIVSVAVIIAMYLTSCGSSKTSVSTQQQTKRNEVKVEEDICIQMADGNPNRAWGEATNGRLSYAKNYAENQARGALARKIEAVITTATKENDLAWEKGSYTYQNGASVRDEGNSANGLTQQIAKQVLRNVVVMKSSIYQQQNGLYHVYVCVEQQDSPEQLASNIAKQVKQQVSDQERIKMQYQFNKFEESIQDELKKMDENLYKQ